MNIKIIGASFTALLLASAPAASQILGSAANFGVLGGTAGVTNTGPTIVTGNVGVWPAASITGFPPGLVVNGFLHRGDVIAQQAQADTTAAYLVLDGLVGAAILPALGGQTLTPGIYNTGGGVADLTGTLTLDGPGRYVIQVNSLTTAAGLGAAIVSLINGATPCDVFWQVDNSAALGTFTVFQGNILALTSITIDTSASLSGRALARNGTVTLASNAVTACSGGTTPGFIVPPVAAIPPLGGNIPTLSEWAMILLATLMAFAGIAAMRRRGR